MPDTDRPADLAVAFLEAWASHDMDAASEYVDSHQIPESDDPDQWRRGLSGRGGRLRRPSQRGQDHRCAWRWSTGDDSCTTWPLVRSARCGPPGTSCFTTEGYRPTCWCSTPRMHGAGGSDPGRRERPERPGGPRCPIAVRGRGRILGLVGRFEEAMTGIDDIEPRRMFGYPAAFVRGNIAAWLHQEAFLVRLPDDLRGERLAAGWSLFEPPPGRRCQEYVVLPTEVVSELDALRSWVQSSIAYTRTLPPKSPKPPKRRAVKRPNSSEG